MGPIAVWITPAETPDSKKTFAAAPAVARWRHPAAAPAPKLPRTRSRGTLQWHKHPSSRTLQRHQHPSSQARTAVAPCSSTAIWGKASFCCQHELFGANVYKSRHFYFSLSSGKRPTGTRECSQRQRIGALLVELFWDGASLLGAISVRIKHPCRHVAFDFPQLCTGQDLLFDYSL